MDLKKEIQQAAAEALEAQQQPKPPAGLPPSQPVMHRQQISRQGTQTRKEPPALRNMYTNCNTRESPRGQGDTQHWMGQPRVGPQQEPNKQAQTHVAALAELF